MLRGERIRLRALEVQDAEVVWRWHQDHEFHVLDGWLYPASLAQMTAWVQSVGTPSFHRVFLGIETESGALVGVVSRDLLSLAQQTAHDRLVRAVPHAEQP